MTIQLPPSASDLQHYLTSIPDPQARFAGLLTLAKQFPAHPDIMTDKYLISGCAAAVWVHIQHDGEHIYFKSHSQARVVHALLHVLLAPLQGQTKEEIQQFDPQAWLEACRISHKLTPSRLGGLGKVVQYLQENLSHDEVH